uniref:Uncharacterized protein n=1 Tax=Lepeophtheirus salmonis TaxID=72036 RepID=A0A0K2U143_LEPSM
MTAVYDSMCALAVLFVDSPILPLETHPMEQRRHDQLQRLILIQVPFE